MDTIKINYTKYNVVGSKIVNSYITFVDYIVERKGYYYLVKDERVSYGNVIDSDDDYSLFKLFPQLDGETFDFKEFIKELEKYDLNQDYLKDLLLKYKAWVDKAEDMYIKQKNAERLEKKQKEDEALFKKKNFKNICKEVFRK